MHVQKLRSINMLQKHVGMFSIWLNFLEYINQLVCILNIKSYFIQIRFRPVATGVMATRGFL
jgi:hypothetical protein